MRAMLLTRDAARALREATRRVSQTSVPTPTHLTRWRAVGSAETCTGAFSWPSSSDGRRGVGTRADTVCHLASTLMSPTHHAVLQQQTKSYSSNTTPHAHSCRDKIHMEALSFHGYHGVLHAEKVLGQKFVVDVTMSVCHLTSGQSDDIKDTVDYASAKDLIERVGAGIATELLKKFEKVIDVTVRVQKPHVAVTGTVGSLGIEVFRQRE
jgi:dihydroneopterin aldolase